MMKRLFYITIIIFFFCGCNIIDKKELERIESPDGKVDVVMIESNGGATTSFSYEIFIVPKGKPVDKKSHPVFIADHVRGLRLGWLKSKLLEIQYTEARIFQFSNFWQHRDVDNFKYEVKIKETEQNS